MTSRVLRPFQDAAWHPTDEQLVSLIDAELRASDADRVRAHLGRCWRCKARHREMEDTIGAFMSAYAEIVEDDEARVDPPRLPIAAIRSLRARSAWPRVTGRVAIAGLRRIVPSRPAVVRLAAVCATAVLVVLLSSNAQVSARQLVQRVDRVERDSIGATTAPVVYQRLEIAHRSLPRAAAGTGVVAATAARATRGTWDVWTDIARHRRRGSVARGSAPDAGTIDVLFALFDSHDMRDAWPVSLRAHQAWRAGERFAIDRISEGRSALGEPTLILETTAAPSATPATPPTPGTPANANAIVSAALVVRAADWHPVEQRFILRDDDRTSELVIRELGFTVVSLASLPVAFFDTATRPVPDANEPATPPVDAKRGPAAADLVTAEVQAMFELHRFGLTSEDDLSVQRRATAIDVSGLTSTPDRRQRLVRALAKIPLVRARIHTAEEAVAAMTARPAHPDAPPLRVDGAHIEADRLPVQTSGGASIGERADQAAMRRARDAVRQSLALLERAWTLRRLAEWSRRTSVQDVTAGTRELIDTMAREHTEAASKALAALDSTVMPALVQESAAATAATTAASSAARAWPDIATDFFGVAAEIDRDTRRLFTASTSPTTEAAEDARRLRRRLQEAAQWLDALRRTPSL